MDTKTYEVTRRRFTVHDYHRMAEVGILREHDRVELIEGDIVEMNPIGSRHAMCVIRLTRLLVPPIGDRALVSPQNPVRLGGRLEPRPDMMLLRARDYEGSLPGPEDVLLLIEVSDTTLAYDRDVKLPLYARSGIREVWIVDLVGKVIECYADPSGARYRRTETARRGETLAPLALAGLALPVDDVLG